MALVSSIRVITLAAILFPWVGTTASSKEQPVFSENFATNTIEVDEKTNETVVQQRLVFDVDKRRSMMYAKGSLVHGALQQIRRCDIHPQVWLSCMTICLFHLASYREKKQLHVYRYLRFFIFYFFLNACV
jgi:hypothetical protein